MQNQLEIRVTDNFVKNLRSIEAFLLENSLSAKSSVNKFNSVVKSIFDTVIPNRQKFPKLGRIFTNRKTCSVLNQGKVEKLQEQLGNTQLREYIHDDYLILYAASNRQVFLLSIKHHKQLTFDFKEIWI